MEKKKDKAETKANDGVNEKLLVALAIVAVALLIIGIFHYFSNRVSTAVDVRFGMLPGNIEKAVILTVNLVEVNASTLDALDAFLSIAEKYDAPITIFLAVDPVVKEFRSYIDDSPQLKNDITGLIALQKKYNITLDIESLGYPIAYQGIPYEYQERLLFQAKSAFRANNISVVAYRPHGAIEYDTLLAAENAQFDVVNTVMGIDDGPMHPKSPLNVDMRLLLVPIYAADSMMFNESRIYIIPLDLAGIKDNSDEVRGILKRARRDSALDMMTIASLNTHIRKTEKMQARIVTDPKRLITDISIAGPVSGAKVEIRSQLLAKNISSQEEFKESYPLPGGLYIILDEDDRNIRIEWKRP